MVHKFNGKDFLCAQCGDVCCLADLTVEDDGDGICVSCVIENRRNLIVESEHKQNLRKEIARLRLEVTALCDEISRLQGELDNA